MNRLLSFCQIIFLSFCLIGLVFAQSIDRPSFEAFNTPSIEELTKNSEFVIIADIRGGKSRWVAKKIVTDWDVVVRDALKGNPEKTLIVTTYGGRVGDIEQDFTHSAQLTPGSTVVLFLAAQNERTINLSKEGFFVAYDEHGVIPILGNNESKSRLDNNVRIGRWLGDLLNQIKANR